MTANIDDTGISRRANAHVDATQSGTTNLDSESTMSLSLPTESNNKNNNNNNNVADPGDAFAETKESDLQMKGQVGLDPITTVNSMGAVEFSNEALPVDDIDGDDEGEDDDNVDDEGEDDDNVDDEGEDDDNVDDVAGDEGDDDNDDDNEVADNNDDDNEVADDEGDDDEGDGDEEDEGDDDDELPELAESANLSNATIDSEVQDEGITSSNNNTVTEETVAEIESELEKEEDEAEQESAQEDAELDAQGFVDGTEPLGNDDEVPAAMEEMTMPQGEQGQGGKEGDNEEVGKNENPGIDVGGEDVEEWNEATEEHDKEWFEEYNRTHSIQPATSKPTAKLPTEQQPGTINVHSPPDDKDTEVNMVSKTPVPAPFSSPPTSKPTGKLPTKQQPGTINVLGPPDDKDTEVNMVSPPPVPAPFSPPPTSKPTGKLPTEQQPGTINGHGPPDDEDTEVNMVPPASVPTPFSPPPTSKSTGKLPTEQQPGTINVHRPPDDEDTEVNMVSPPPVPAPFSPRPTSKPTGKLPTDEETKVNMVSPPPVPTPFSPPPTTSRNWDNSKSPTGIIISDTTSSNQHSLAFYAGMSLVPIILLFCLRKYVCRSKRPGDTRGEYRAVAARYGDMGYDNTFSDAMSDDEDDDFMDGHGDIEDDSWGKAGKRTLELPKFKKERNGGLSLAEMNG